MTKDNSLLHREAGKWANGFTEIRRRVVTLQIMEILQHILHLWKWPCRWKWGWGRGEMGLGRREWQKQRVQLDRFTTFHGSTHPCCYRKDSGVYEYHEEHFGSFCDQWIKGLYFASYFIMEIRNKGNRWTLGMWGEDERVDEKGRCEIGWEKGQILMNKININR